MLSGSPDLRVSDDDREAMCAWLGVNYAQGRLDDDELERRLARVVAAVTTSELEAVASDLPAPPSPPAPSPVAPRRPWGLADVQAALVLPVVVPALLLSLIAGPAIWPAWVWLLCLAPIVWAVAARALPVVRARWAVTPLRD